MTFEFPDFVTRSVDGFPVSGTWLVSGLPKSGKSSTVAGFPSTEDNNNARTLILDTQGGYASGGISGTVVDLEQRAKDENTTPLKILGDAIRAINAWPDVPPYDAVVLDVFTDVVLWIERDILARAAADSLNSKGEKEDLSYGKGFEIEKDRLIKLINGLRSPGRSTILVAHTTPSEIDTSALTRTLECPKRLRAWLTGVVDHMLFIYKEGGKCWGSFAGFSIEEESGRNLEVSGSRHECLDGNVFEIPKDDPWRNIRAAYEDRGGDGTAEKSAKKKATAGAGSK